MLNALIPIKTVTCPEQLETATVTYTSMSIPVEYFNASANINQSNVFLVSNMEKLTLKSIRQSKTTQELVSEIGGWLGLLVGASTVTLAEIGQFILDVAEVLFGGRRGKEEEEQEEGKGKSAGQKTFDQSKKENERKHEDLKKIGITEKIESKNMARISPK